MKGILLNCLKGTMALFKSKPVNGALKAYANCKYMQYGVTSMEVDLMKNQLRNCIKYGIPYTNSIFKSIKYCYR